LPKLGSNELEAVATFPCAEPRSLEGLRVLVETEFGVHWTPEGFKNMRKKQVGVIHP
jgi:hypothetical protein